MSVSSVDQSILFKNEINHQGVSRTVVSVSFVVAMVAIVFFSAKTSNVVAGMAAFYIGIFFKNVVWKNPPTVQQQQNKDSSIIGVGDVHGTLVGLKEILKHAGVIQENWWSGVHWIGTKTLVQMGDAIDRGPHSRQVWQLLGQLQDEAPKNGGKVVRLLGNHELLILEGEFGVSTFCTGKNDAFRRQMMKDVKSGRVQAAYFDGTYIYVHGRLCRSILGIVSQEIRSKREDFSCPVSSQDIVDHLNQQLIHAVSQQERNETNGKAKSEVFAHASFGIGKFRDGPEEVGGIYWECFDNQKLGRIENIDTPQIVAHVPAPFSGPLIRSRDNMTCIDVGLCDVYGGRRGYVQVNGSEITAWEKERWPLRWIPRLLTNVQAESF